MKRLTLPALLLFFIFAGIYVARNTSSTTDEAPFHMVDGYVSLKTHDFRLNPASPAFAREWVALPWLFFDLRLDLARPDWKEADSLPLGLRVFYEDNRSRALLLLFISRLMNLLLGAALIAVVFRWSYELHGFFGALISGVMTAFTPSILAHSAIAATDLPVTFWSVFFLFSLWKWARSGRRQWLFFTALSLGLAQSSKFTALFLYPALALILWREKGPGKAARYFGFFLVSSLLVVWATYFFEFKPLLTNCPRIDEKLGMIQEISLRLFPGRPSIAEALKNAALHWPIPLPTYFLGIAGILRNHQEAYRHYFNGVWTTDAQWFYYLAAFFVKMTPAFLALLVIRMAASMKVRTPKNLFFFTLIPAAIFFIATLRDSTAVGMRYILITVPLMAVWSGGLAAVKMGSEKAGKAVLGALLCFHAASFGLSFPYCLEYFNFLIGGTPSAYRYFRGSDVDWGQGLVYLRQFMRKNALEGVVLEYFGTADPSLYQIAYRKPSSDEIVRPRDEVYAVSVHYLEHLEWTKDLAPDRRLGSAIFIYDRRARKTPLV